MIGLSPIASRPIAAPSAFAHNYRIAGTEVLDGDDSPSLTQVIAWPESPTTPGWIDLTALPLTTVPDAETGAWEMNGLRGGTRYAIGFVPPECYAAELLRWYSPVRAD